MTALLARNTAFALALLCLSGCTTLRPIEDFSPSQIRQRVDVGDHVRIVTLTGATYELDVTGLYRDQLHGRNASGQVYKVHFEAIRTIEVADVTGWKVATITGVGITALAVTAFALLLHLLSGG